MNARPRSAWICLVTLALLGSFLPGNALSQEEPVPGSFEDRIAELFPAVQPELPVQAEFEEVLELMDGREVAGYRRVFGEGEEGLDEATLEPLRSLGYIQ